MKYDIAIIGSGLGGLVCSHILASRGRRVVVIERESQPGGCLQSYRRGKLAFDTGLHYVGGLAAEQPLYNVFKQLGLMELPWVRLDSDGFDLVTIEGRTYRMANGFDKFVDTLAADFPAERKALECYADLMKQSEKLEPELTKRLFETNAWEWLNANFNSKLLVNVLSGAAMKLELRKDTLPLFTFLHCNSGYVQSAWRLRGDGNMIVDKLVDGIRSYGGDVVCGAEVRTLVEHDGRITEAICADGRRFEADRFISDVHPALTCSLVGDSKRIRKVYRRRMNELPNTMGMFTASLVLKPNALRYFNYNHYVYRHANVWDFYEQAGETGGVMVSCRVPESGEWAEQIDLLTPMPWAECKQWSGTTVGRRGEDYKAMKSRKAAECIALAESVVPGLAESVERIYTSTPLTYRDYTLTPCGSAFGVRKDCHDSLLTQLSVRTPVPNLFLTGQSLVLHGLQGVTMTALETVKALEQS